MKSKHLTKPLAVAVAVAVALALVFFSLPSTFAQKPSTTEWSGADGDWADATWNPAPPMLDDLAAIQVPNTVTVTAPTAPLEQLLLNAGATLNINDSLIVQGIDRIDNDDPTPDVPGSGFWGREATINVNVDGELFVDDGGEFRVAQDAVGALNLFDAGSITTDRTFALGSGDTGDGTMTQTGGTFTHTGAEFKVGAWGGKGQYDLSGGTLNASRMQITFAGNVVDSTFNQTGGDVVTTGGDWNLALGWNSGDGGDATYNLSGGTLTTDNRIRLGIGGNPGTQLFNQTGGTVSVEGGGAGRIDIGENAANTSTYAISGGILTTEGRILVGAHNTGIGNLEVSGSANVNLFGCFVGNKTTSVGTVMFTGDPEVSIGQFEVRNGTATQSTDPLGSGVTITSRFRVGESLTVTTPASYTLSDGNLNLFNNQNVIGYNGNTENATLNIEGGTLTTTSRLRVGIGAGDGSLTPTNLVNQTGGIVDVSGRVDLGENPGPSNIYQISGGSLRASGDIKVGFWNDGTGTFMMSGTAEVDTPQVVLGESLGDNIVVGAVGTAILDGGTLTTDKIKVGNGDSAEQTLSLNGVTIKARVDGADLIDGNVTTASLMSGGITFDDNGFNVSTTAVMTGPGGLSKKGAGTLTVNSVQAYTGETKVEAGTLSLTEAYLADGSTLDVTTGAILDLPHGGSDTIAVFKIDGVPQSTETTYGGPDSGADVIMPTWTGLGVLNAVGTSSSVPPVITSITVIGEVATLTIRGAALTTYTCNSSTDLGSFDPITTTPAVVTTSDNLDGTGDATFTVDASGLRKFYAVEE